MISTRFERAVESPQGTKTRRAARYVAGVRAGRLSGADYGWMAAGFAFCLALSYALGRGRIFWEDEMLGWMLLTDPSWHHMVEAWKLGADGGGFAFYATGRAWLHLFGPSEVAFRMYSATCFGLAFAVTWATARRFYGRWIVGLALFNTWFCSPPIVLHLVEGRFYGLLMLATCVGFWLAFEVRDLPGRVPVGYCLLLFAVHGVLTTSHLLGVVYSFFLLLGMVAMDVLDGRLCLTAYASVALSWLLLVPEREAIQASAAVGKPWFWTVPPTAIRLFGPLTAFSGEVLFAMAALAVLAALALARPGWRSRLTGAFRARCDVYLMTLALLLVPVAFLVEGLFGPSLFINRYLMPVSIASALITAELLTLIRESGMVPAWNALRWAAAFALAGTILFWDFRHLPGFIMAQPAYTGRLSAMLPRGVPVLLEDAWIFTEVIGREHASGVDYVYPLDWEQSVSRYAPRLEVTQYNLMNDWRKAGYFSGSVVDLKQFLAKTPRFLVVDGEVPGLKNAPPPMIGNPLLSRFLKTPGYTVMRYAALDRGGLVLTAWLVMHDPKRSGYPAPGALPPL